jgi:hypothetical protein
VKGASLTTLIQCTSVWFAGSKFGLSWKAKQIRMDKVPESIRGYAFLDDDDVPAPKTSARPAAGQNKFASLAPEDEEEGEEDEAFEAPPPSKPNVLQAMMPKPSTGPSHPVTAPAPAAATLDDDAEDHEPIPVPAGAGKKTTTTTAKKIVAKVGVKK